MVATAYLVHHIAGRVRLRFPSQKADLAYFAGLRRALLEWPEVRAVLDNATTASVLVHHGGSFDELARRAAERGLFVVVRPTLEPDAAMQPLRERIGLLDAWLQERTRGAWGLTSVTFYALLGASVYQLARGEFLPKGGALLAHAVQILAKAAEQQRRPGG